MTRTCGQCFLRRHTQHSITRQLDVAIFLSYGESSKLQIYSDLWRVPISTMQHTVTGHTCRWQRVGPGLRMFAKGRCAFDQCIASSLSISQLAKPPTRRSLQSGRHRHTAKPTSRGMVAFVADLVTRTKAASSDQYTFTCETDFVFIMKLSKVASSNNRTPWTTQ